MARETWPAILMDHFVARARLGELADQRVVAVEPSPPELVRHQQCFETYPL